MSLRACTRGYPLINDRQLIALKQSSIECEDAIKPNDSDLHYRKNVEFQECIYSACGNVFLTEETRSLRRRLQSFRRLQLRVRGRMSRSLDEHSQIIEAIRSGDASQVDLISKQHVLILGERFNDPLAHIEQDP